MFAVYPQHLPSRGNAKSVCSAFNSSVAEIVSDDMLHKVVNYIRESWFPKNPNWTQPDLNMWLGSIFHVRTVFRLVAKKYLRETSNNLCGVM